MRPDWLNQRLTKKNQVRSQFRPQLEWLEDRLAPATFTVRNTFDVGPDSLRQAILDANANQALDNIVFAIPGDGVHTIFLADQMIITDPVIIDGYTQQGASGDAEKTTVAERARHGQEARMWYDRGVANMAKHRPENEELKRFRAEAAELLGIKEPPPKPPMK